MSDLISRSALLDDMQKELEKAVNDKDMTEFDCKVLMTSALALKNFVNRQPTAYSIDKVVEELECDRCESCSFLEVCAGTKCCGKCHEKIIEIVKQGGVSDDVCEWKYNDAEYYWESSCENLHIFMADGPKENKYEYCPYCGKKIKAVE